MSGWIEERKNKRTDVRTGGWKKERKDRRKKEGQMFGKKYGRKGEQKEIWK